MGTLYIAEYANVSDAHVEEPPLAEQTVPIDVASHASAAFQPATRTLRIHCDTACSIAIGTYPVATAKNQRLVANQTEHKGVPARQGFKIAVIEN